jgi:hypothetical protein
LGFKKITRNLDCADLALANGLEQNPYTLGTSEQGARAYPPLMLFKCLLLQKWFRIPSGPDLENQITDRLSFKTFLGLSFSQPAPDHSTFSRFRSRLPKEAMNAVDSRHGFVLATTLTSASVRERCRKSR